MNCIKAYKLYLPFFGGIGAVILKPLAFGKIHSDIEKNIIFDDQYNYYPFIYHKEDETLISINPDDKKRQIRELETIKIELTRAQKPNSISDL